MTDRTATARLWAETLTETTDDRISALEAALAEEVVTTSALGTVEGKTAVLDSLGKSPIAPLFAQGRWSDVMVTGEGTATITCTFPPAAPVGGVSAQLTFDDADRI